MTFSMPEQIKREMEKFPEINWSEIARAAIKKRIILLKKFREFAGESDLTEEEAILLGKEVNQGVVKRNRK